MANALINKERENNNSLWHEVSDRPKNFSRLEETIETEVLIIGGGFTGLSTALHLSKNGISNALIEKNKIATGASGRNVGYVNAGLWLEPSEVERRAKITGKTLVTELSSAPALVFKLIE